MNVLFVYSSRSCRSPRIPLESLQDIHLGISYISAVLRAGGHSIRSAVLSSEWARKSAEMLGALMDEFHPRLVCFTSVSSQYGFVHELARGIKARWPDTFLLVGGACVSLDPQAAIGDPFDALCVGEGEYPAAELVEALEAGRSPLGIANLWIKTPAGSVEANPTRPFLADLDQLPFPDRRMWEPWVRPGGKARHTLLVSRGCPFRCAYCSNHALCKLAEGRYVRFRSPANIVAEAAHLRRSYPEVREVYLQSETIALDLDWVGELGDRLAEFNRSLAEPLRFGCNLRVTRACLDERFFSAFARANVRTVEIGLESGSERVRQQILRRTYTNQEFLAAVDLARRHGMRVNLYNMVGLPTETPAEHLETVEMNRRVCPDQCYTSIFYPYPGTDLYTVCEAQGLLKHHLPTAWERSVATLDLPTFPRPEIQRAYDWFEFRVYRGRRSFLFRLRKLISCKMLSPGWLGALFNRLLPLWHRLRERHGPPPAA
ncbi:MAG: B12-binding domain-containing radical SAM protein [Limisphaerales bacterium]